MNMGICEKEETMDGMRNRNVHGQFEKRCKCVSMENRNVHIVYLDYNATTYIRPEVSNLLSDYYMGRLGFGNPSSRYSQGIKALGLIDGARRKLARFLSVDAGEIYFTGSGTEANNMAIKGIAFKHFGKRAHIITSSIEHNSVLDTVRYLETIGFSATYLDVDRNGMVSAESVRKAIRNDTILVSVMAANNEIGTINPLAKIGQVCSKRNIPLMADGIQAFGKIPLDLKRMGVSLFSFSGHKIYAPKGIGGLFVDKNIRLVPLIHGGGQESGLRSGTENVGGVIALGRAAELAYGEMMFETVRQLELREYFLKNLKKIEPSMTVNGSLRQRLPNNLSISFRGIDGRALITSLHKAGISVSGNCSCKSGTGVKSHVLEAIGIDEEKYATVRISFGLKTDKEQLDYVIKCLSIILPSLKRN